MFTALLYIILFAICFTNTFQGIMTTFYLKYIISIIWIIIFIIKLLKTNKILTKGKDYWKLYCIPYIIIFFWSLFCMFFNRHLQFSNISRLFGQTIYLLITYTTVVAAVHFYKEKVLVYSLYAMVLSIFANLLITIKTYGLSNFFLYLKSSLVNVTFARGTVLYSISSALEVQDITIAAGLYIIYYLFFDKEKNKKNIILSCICFLLGFKRTGLVALIVTVLLYMFIKRKSKTVNFNISIITILCLTSSFMYLIIIKYNLLELLSLKYSINVMGRVQIYQNLSNFFRLSPLFVGHGFGYVDKIMFETTGFVSHTVIGKMFAELGFIPFILWVFYLVKIISKKINGKYGYNNCLLYLISIVYMFITYFFENTLTLYCVQYTFLLIPLIYTTFKEDKKNEK